MELIIASVAIAVVVFGVLFGVALMAMAYMVRLAHIPREAYSRRDFSDEDLRRAKIYYDKI